MNQVSVAHEPEDIGDTTLSAHGAGRSFRDLD
jgi:hypothetical protein